MATTKTPTGTEAAAIVAKASAARATKDAAAKRPAKTPAKKPAAKIDTAVCRGGQGRYLSAKSSKACTNPRHPGRQLCDTCETVYRTAKKAAKPKAAPKAEAPKPKVVHLDPMAREIAAVRAMKERQAEPPARVAAMVAPEVTVTKK
jgi:hypothetical protein